MKVTSAGLDLLVRDGSILYTISEAFTAMYTDNEYIVSVFKEGKWSTSVRYDTFPEFLDHIKLIQGSEQWYYLYNDPTHVQSKITLI